MQISFASHIFTVHCINITSNIIKETTFCKQSCINIYLLYKVKMCL